MRTHLIVLAAAAAALLGAATGCSSAPATAPATKHVGFVVNGCPMSVTLGEAKPAVAKPAIPACAAAPPRTITVTVVHGHGPAATTGDGVGVRYVGVDWADVSHQFDANWGKAPFTVSPIGSAQVIAGWNLALLGVHVGDRVVMAIPAADGYGAQGAAPLVKPNENLLFVADILSLTQASAVPTPSG